MTDRRLAFMRNTFLGVTLFSTGQLTAADGQFPYLHVYLNTPNCSAHTAGVMMLGSIDQRCARAVFLPEQGQALRAAMTGHLVLSTLHTNDAVSSAMRLVDMGTEGFLAATAIRAVLAQRLVRRLCEYCSAEHDPSPRDRAWIEKVSGVTLAPAQRLQQASGCHRCNNTGYRGRVGVFELLVINDEMADALRRTDSSGFVKAARASRGYQPLVKSAVLDAIAGITSLDEVFIVAEQIDETGDWVFEAQEHG